jgi:hypothetical protein
MGIASAITMGGFDASDSMRAISYGAEEDYLDLYLEDMTQTVYCPDLDAWHTHGYRNESGPNDGYDYYMAVTKLRIYLHDDFMESIALDDMECSVPITTDTPEGYVNCNNARTDTAGGTSIDLVEGDTSSDAIYENYIEWEYGLDDSDDKPVVPGYNDYDGDGTVDVTEDDRTFYETLDFDFNSDVETGDSATTTSALYVQFWRYDVDCGVWSDSDCWTALEEDGESDKHWNNHTYTLETVYECEAVACDTLTITPTTAGLSVDDVFSDTDFSVTVTDTDGNDITDDVDFDYSAFKYGTSTSSTPNADGNIGYGVLNLRDGGNELTGTSDDTITYENSEPGDTLTVCVSDFDGVDYCGTNVCEAEVQFPYCTELNITDPSSMAFITSGSLDIPIEVEAEANTGEAWPYSLDYDSTDPSSTFDGQNPVYTTNDYSIDSYQSEVTGSVQVDLDDENGDGEDDDVAGACSDWFSYGIDATCEELVITIPSSDPLTCEEITAEDIEITWESTMTSGAPATGPWMVTSTDTAGTFSLTPGGATVGTGAGYLSTTTTLYYTSSTTDGGDTIMIFDTSYPDCIDILTSETCEEEAPVCEDLTLSDPYVVNDDGTTTTIDLTDNADLETLYADSEVCWDYTMNVSDATYSGRLVASGYTDSSATTRSGLFDINLTSNEMGTSDRGNPATLPISGSATYTGTVCMRNFEAGNYMEIFALGDAATCSDSEELPPYTPEENVCVDLQMSPDSYTMTSTETETGDIAISITVSGSDSSWTGTLVVENTGGGDLFYSDGSPSEFGDGHLEIPVSGLSSTVNVTFTDGREGDTVSSYVLGDEGLCSDEFTITKQPENVICEDLQLSPDSVSMDLGDEDAGTINGTVTVQASDSSWTGTLIIERDGSGELYYSDGSSSGYGDGHLSIPVSGTSSTVTFTYRNGEATDTVSAYIDNEENLCSDDFTIDQPVEVCEDIEFEDDELQVDYNCEDVDTSVCVEGAAGQTSRTIEICYEDEDGDDGEWEYNGRTYEGCHEITVNVDAGEEECLDLTFNEVCEDAQIEVLENGEVCEDIPVEEVELGEFEKFIYTFNFASEKNSYSDDGVFFSHDEDRAFYTLQYDPTGDEEAITFTDDMWDGDLEGTSGDGDSSGGNVSLATTSAELMEGESGFYNYSLITNMGFGDEHEENSQDIADGLNSGEIPVQSFVAYVKYSYDDDSVYIRECEYDEDDELETEGVCYDPDHFPETTGDVVIENAGTVEEDYGEGATIRIRYVGVIDSGLDCGDEADECLTEEFENHAEVSVYNGFDSLEADARLVVLCSYLMTQNAGDVYLEVSLEAGSDISCIFVDEEEATSSDYRNTDALVILEDTDSGSSSTSTLSNSYSSSTVSFCDDDSSNSLISNLSSYVCEIVAKVASVWSSTIVEETTESHLSIAARNAETAQLSNDDSYANWAELEDTLTNTNNEDSHILYFDGSQSSGTLTLGALEVPAGAWTVVVDGANLRLNGNITYASVSNPSDYKNLPSIAFVVLGGDIYIDNLPSTLSGVFYTDQKFDGDERSAVNEQLTVIGSIYGNIQTLIERAKYVGPPTIDGGGIVIKYDSRILLNTPPGLSEYVDINTEKGVN